MLYAALGDSITHGYDASTTESAWVQRFLRNLSRTQTVNLYLHTKPGWTSGQLAKSLAKVPDVIWAEAKLVTILVGGNDLLRASPRLLNGNYTQVYKVAERVQDNLEAALATVRRKDGIVILGTLYNPFPNSLLAEEYTQTVNHSIRRVANRNGTLVAELERLFHNREDQFIEGYRKGNLRDMRLFGNPIHPNDKGHEAIAKAFLRTYRSAKGASPRAKKKA